MRLGYDAGYGVGPGAAGVNNDEWVAWIKQAIGEYREVQPYFYGDFYPLLPYSRDAESLDGLAVGSAGEQRRPDHAPAPAQESFPVIEVRARRLNPDATYEVEIRTTYEHAPIRKMKGKRTSAPADSIA